MAITKAKLKKYDHLLDDDMIADTIKDLQRVRQRMSDYLEDNHERKSCPVCNRKNIRYEYYGVICNDCGWHEDIEIPFKDLSLTRKFYSLLKQKFGQAIGTEKSTQKLTTKSIKKLPIDLMDFDTGEYTPIQVDYLSQRFKEILNTKDVSFDEKDLATIHFLVLQEMKVKDLYRQEAISNTKATDKEFTRVKKNEIGLYNDLKEDLEEIIEKQKTSEKELAVYDKVNFDFKTQDIDDMLSEIHKQRKEEQEELKKSRKRRQQILQGDLDIEDEIEEAVGDEYNGTEDK